MTVPSVQRLASGQPQPGWSAGDLELRRQQSSRLRVTVLVDRRWRSGLELGNQGTGRSWR